ncbi:MAG TPA: FAD-binding oxidoreductase [Paraburkholderia sp.]|uniref:FAD-binding oxidoreductase n=1 Tax=Paraburkholderia sp. TaxID=1926495 RepID=UPI002ED4007E
MHTIEKFPQIDGELGWLETAPNSEAQSGPRVKGAQTFDFAVIGAGFTGISAATRLAELHPSARIALVDALRVGQGSSGRNAGFLIDLPHNVDYNETGVDYARSHYRLNTFAIDRLRGFKDKYDIPFWHDAGKYMAGHEPESQRAREPEETRELRLHAQAGGIRIRNDLRLGPVATPRNGLLPFGGVHAGQRPG